MNYTRLVTRVEYPGHISVRTLTYRWRLEVRNSRLLIQRVSLITTQLYTQLPNKTGFMHIITKNGTSNGF